MAHRIEIALKRNVRDARGRGVAATARYFLHLPLEACETRQVYKVDVELDRRQLTTVQHTFTDSVICNSSTGRHRPPRRFDWLIEVGFKHGVTDNVGRTAGIVVSDILGRPLHPHEEVYTATQYFIRAPGLDRDAVHRLACEQLANDLIHSIQIFDPEGWAHHPVDESVPRLEETPPISVQTYNLEGSDEALVEISRHGILSLSLNEMKAIRNHYRLLSTGQTRESFGLPAHPTDVELECIAQTWSEHCKHKIFAARVRYINEQGDEEIIDSLFNTYIRASTQRIGERIDWLVSVFSDNAGVIRFNDRYNLVFKVETHNSPSALDPYGGAMTGIVGCNRDPMGTGVGSELLFNTWGYCLGSPFYEGELPRGLFHPRRIRDGVHLGVIDGGNQSGIPWARGFERFDDRFIGKPLVFCGTVGRIPVEVGGRPSERKEVEAGDAVVMVGGRIGKDGIHGATFSSEELRAESPAQAVQIGDPITQRKMYEFLLEARDRGWYRCITDNGAGGLSSSVGEMATLCGGAELDLSLAPLKYEGLQPWEIFLSEAQERMTLAVPPGHVKDLIDLAAKRDVEATAIGTFHAAPNLILRHGERVVAHLDMRFLHDGCPRLELEARWQPARILEPVRPKAGPRNKLLKALLADLNICSREYKSRMYDSEVKGLSIIKPFTGVHRDIPSDATVLLADLDSREGVVLAEGINPFYSDLDTYHMMAGVIDEGVRRIVSAGGEPDRIAGLDNFCWPDPVASEATPDGAHKMAQLVRANQALYDVTTAYNVPCISGKDSMKNDSVRGGRKISIPPTVLFSTLGRIPDIERALTLAFKAPGDPVFLVGLTRAEMGASAFHRHLAAAQGRPGDFGGQVPVVHTALAGQIYRAMGKATGARHLRSSHTPTQGGLAVGLALCALAGDRGAEIDLGAAPIAGSLTDDTTLFSESHSRFIVTCEAGDESVLASLFEGLPFSQIGTVVEEPRLVVRGRRGRVLIQSPLRVLRAAFRRTLDGQ
jgi:phosphoribosylformylglycinamidine synthase II